MMNDTMEIRHDLKGDILILRLAGRLDALVSPEVEKQVFQFIDRGQHKIIMDFSGVDYISSAGMRVLLAVMKKLKNYKGHMILCSVVDNVMEVFRLAGFDHVLQIDRTEAEALVKLERI